MAARRGRKRSGRRQAAAEEEPEAAADAGAAAPADEEEPSAPEEDVAMADADGGGPEAAEDGGSDGDEKEAAGAEEDGAAPRGHARRRSKRPVADRPARKRRDSRFRMYIYRVLKQVHSGIGISKAGMDVMNSFVEDMFGKIMREAQQLVQYQKRNTIGHREVTSAAKLVLFGELAKHAESEANKALRLYLQSMQGAPGGAARAAKKKTKGRGKAAGRRGKR